jgi:ribosomal protein S27AE
MTDITPRPGAAQAAPDAYTDATGKPVEIKRYPTALDIRCPACGHTGTATIFLADASKLKCGKCGCTSPEIAGREPLRTWAARRLKQNAHASAPVGTRPRTKRGR